MHLFENMWEPDVWIKVFFQVPKFMMNSGIVPSTSFVLIWIDIIGSLKSFSPEEVIATHSKHCQEQECEHAHNCLSSCPRGLGRLL